ncbi:MAG: UDP-N-acetylmuramate dehydrogenase [Clostridia bacterium]|nr:UDP-N-acetylmuramate dehydrogenase [Clostridia bacterium]
MNQPDITKALQAFGCTVKEGIPMSAHTSFKIGGAADRFVSTADIIQAALIIRFCTERQIPLLVVGNGSNLLVSDGGIDGVVLHIEAGAIAVDGTRMTVQAGASLTRACLTACENGLSGLEFAYGIPGTMGGGVYMNAGAYGGQLSDVVRSVTALTAGGEIVELSAEQLTFGYRHSVFMEQPLTVWLVTLELQVGDPAVIRSTMEEHMAARKEKQPLDYPSGGSFFKRPEGHFAGALVEQCGLKGFTVGGAQVSEKHAGFVINRGGATCADVMALCRQVQKKVQETFGISLEREVQLVGR